MESDQQVKLIEPNQRQKILQKFEQSKIQSVFDNYKKHLNKNSKNYRKQTAVEQLNNFENWLKDNNYSQNNGKYLPIDAPPICKHSTENPMKENIKKYYNSTKSLERANRLYTSVHVWATCCDPDGLCFGDGTDQWCCGKEFYCSSNSYQFAKQKGGILCPFNPSRQAAFYTNIVGLGIIGLLFVLAFVTYMKVIKKKSKKTIEPFHQVPETAESTHPQGEEIFDPFADRQVHRLQQKIKSRLKTNFQNLFIEHNAKDLVVAVDGNEASEGQHSHILNTTLGNWKRNSEMAETRKMDELQQAKRDFLKAKMDRQHAELTMDLDKKHQKDVKSMKAKLGLGEETNTARYQRNAFPQLSSKNPDPQTPQQETMSQKRDSAQQEWELTPGKSGNSKKM